MTAQETERRGGPHAGIRIVGIAGLGVTPCGCMMLADVGADAVRIEVSAVMPRPRQAVTKDGGRPDTTTPAKRNMAIRQGGRTTCA